MATMQSFAPIASKKVDFKALNINMSSHQCSFLSSCRIFWYIVVHMACSQMMFPHSKLEQMKHLKIWISRSGYMSGNSGSLLYDLLHLFVISLMWGINERLFFIIIHNNLWVEPLLRDTPYMVSGIGGGLGFSSLVIEQHVCGFWEYLLIFAILNISFGDW